MSDLKDLSTFIATIAENLVPAVSQVVREVYKAAGTVVVFTTPVDTGRARINWQGAFNYTPINPVYWPRPSKPDNPDDAMDVAMRYINGAASQYQGSGYLVLANNLPYIADLNNGTSQQAPSGFVEQGVLMGIKALDNKTILISTPNYKPNLSTVPLLGNG